MTEELSSSMTFLFKYGFPVAGLIIGGVIVAAVLVDPQQHLVAGGNPLPSWAAWIVVAMFLLGGIIAWRLLRSLVRLALGSDHVELWTLRARHKIPLREIREVRARAGSSGVLVDVEFRGTTPFGDRVSFLATTPDAAARLESRVSAAR